MEARGRVVIRFNVGWGEWLSFIHLVSLPLSAGVSLAIFRDLYYLR